MAVESRPRIALPLAVAMLLAGPAGAAGLDEAQVRALVAEQQRSWNAGGLEAWAATFRTDAAFTDQYLTPAGQLVPYGTSTLPQAKTQSRKFRATSKVSETGRIIRIALGPDRRSALVVSKVVSQIRGPKGARTTCAERRQDVILGGDGLRSRGQTDTFSRCPR
jgi:hypothetical protein